MEDVGVSIEDIVVEGDLGTTKGPREFTNAAEIASAWVSDENPTSDPEVFRALAARMSPMQG